MIETLVKAIKQNLNVLTGCEKKALAKAYADEFLSYARELDSPPLRFKLRAIDLQLMQHTSQSPDLTTLYSDHLGKLAYYLPNFNAQQHATVLYKLRRELLSQFLLHAFTLELENQLNLIAKGVEAELSPNTLLKLSMSRATKELYQEGLYQAELILLIERLAKIQQDSVINKVTVEGYQTYSCENLPEIHALHNKLNRTLNLVDIKLEGIKRLSFCLFDSKEEPLSSKNFKERYQTFIKASRIELHHEKPITDSDKDYGQHYYHLAFLPMRNCDVYVDKDKYFRRCKTDKQIRQSDPYVYKNIDTNMMREMQAIGVESNQGCNIRYRPIVEYLSPRKGSKLPTLMHDFIVETERQQEQMSKSQRITAKMLAILNKKYALKINNETNGLSADSKPKLSMFSILQAIVNWFIKMLRFLCFWSGAQHASTSRASFFYQSTMKNRVHIHQDDNLGLTN